MGRKKKYSEKEFTRAYRKAKSLPELATTLHMTTAAVRYNLSLYGFAPYLLKDKVNPLKIAKRYRGKVTTKNLVTRFKLSITTIRYHLQKLVLYPDKYSLSEDWPPPKKIYHIKIINALIKDKHLVDSPRELPLRLGLSISQVDDYWYGVFGHNLEEYHE